MSFFGFVVSHQPDVSGNTRIVKQFGWQGYYGFIAQDLEDLKDEGYHFGGVTNSKYNGGEDVYSVGYTEIIAPLVKSVQELSEEVNNLRRENNYLKAKIDGGNK